MTGQLLGDRYQVERELGKHTGRWTLLAHDLHAKERVVIRLLCADEAVDSDSLKRFDREVETLKSLSHPAIPKYLGYFQHRFPQGRTLALVQSYVAGRSLSDCLAQGRCFTEAEAKQIAKSILYILIYFQSRKPPIVHREIKPSNVLLGDRKIYLVDFGSVTLQDERSMFMPADEFAPPEHYSGRSLTASDLYSLGLTIIAIVTGLQPSQFPRRGGLDLNAIVDLSPAFVDWLQWMTEPSLDRRLGSATAALQALDAGQVRSA